MTNVVLTGGVGSRLWPLSRKTKPKQYIDLFEGKSLFQQTIMRNKPFCNKLLIVGNSDNSNLSQQAMEHLEIANCVEIVEATPRNTAAAIAFAAFSVNAEEILLVTPSDHLIQGQKEYETSINEALILAENDFIVTFGLVPTKPETGFGYIQIQNNDVLSFREKPNLETAQEFIGSGDFYWNSGMFCFKAGVFLDELKKLQPKVYSSAMHAYSFCVDGKVPLEESLNIPSISVDYAVMEKTDKIKAVKAKFKWSDMGSFESLYDYLRERNYPVDKNENMVIGTNIHAEFLGFKKCILVITDDAILVLRKDKAQKVRDVYESLDDNNLR